MTDKRYCYLRSMTAGMMEFLKEVTEERAFEGASSPFSSTAFYQQGEGVFRVSKANISALRNLVSI